MASIEKRGGSYYVRWSTDDNGKRKSHSKTFPMHRDAAAFKKQLETDSLSGRQCSYDTITLEKYLDGFFDTYSANLTGNTEHCNRRYMANHIIPRIGNVRLKDLTVMTIQQTYNDIMLTPYRPAEVKKINGVDIAVTPAQYYSAKTIVNIHGVLTKALSMLAPYSGSFHSTRVMALCFQGSKITKGLSRPRRRWTSSWT